MRSCCRHPQAGEDVPRPRFAKLPEAQRETILRAAVAEFAAYGFADASLNRIIEAAGISKGSLYYYFDGKEDLYAHVARQAMTGLLEREGPFAVPMTAADPDAFWDVLTGYYLRLMRALLADPVVAALVRGWIVAAGNPELAEVQRELEQTGLPWFLTVITVGQQIGAVRTDLPSDLLLAVVFGMGQAMDVWLIGSGAGQVGAEVMPVEEAAPAMVGMIRRALQP
jgi:AcrR family transcriptional regulator